jgi:hypothetical protein
MLRRVALVRTDISEECITSIIRVTRIDELGTTLAVTSKWSTLRGNTIYTIARWFFPPWLCRRYLPPKRRVWWEPHIVTSQKMAFWMLYCTKTIRDCFNAFPVFPSLSASRWLPHKSQDGILYSTLLSLWPPLRSSGQTSRLQTQRSRVRFPALADFLSSSGSGTGSTQPREDKWGGTWKKSSGSCL